MIEQRKEIPYCQVGVYSGGSPDHVDDCSEPSIAIWNWGDGDLYACEKHDKEFQQEAEDEIEKAPEHGEGE